MSLAYVILTHKLPRQVARLISVLYHSEDTFLIHVDGKVDATPFVAAITDDVGSPPNIGFIDPVRCDWAGFGHLEATLRGIDQIFRQRSEPTHIVLLTGQDYPIKPLHHIRAHFATNAGLSFMSSSSPHEADAGIDRRGNPRWFWDGNLDRLELRHYLVGGRWVGVPNRFTPMVPRRSPPLGLLPYQGLAYWSLSIDAVRFVREQIIEHAELLRFFRRVLIPDEFFFQMVLLNSALREQVINEDLRYMIWEGFHPATLGIDHTQEMAQSPKLFARKFDSTVDVSVLDALDRMLQRA